MSDKIKIGVDRIIINPPLGTYLIGYANRKGGAKEVHDNLTATTLVLNDNSDNLFALISLDLLGLNWEIVNRIKDRINKIANIPQGNIRIFCSHTHSGPIGWAPSEINSTDRISELLNKVKLMFVEPFKTRGMSSNKLYYDNLIKNLADSVKIAASSMAKVYVEHTKIESEFSINRRAHLDSESCIDKEIHFIKFVNEYTTIASIINYACHNVALGPGCNAVSADITGDVRSKVENKIGGLCLFIQGAAADINPDIEWGENNFEDIKRIGSIISKSVLSSVSNMKVVKSSPINFLNDKVKGYIDIPKEVKKESEKKIPKIMINIREKVPKWIIYPLLSVRFPWKTELEKDKNGYYTSIEVGVLRIGDILITSVSMEPFSKTGLKIKKRSDFPITLFAGYSDGLTGYLPTSKDCDIGGYEIELAPYFYKLPGTYRKNTEEIVVNKMKRLISKLV
ncbi:MAG TPA: hypothetical protein QF753_11535 [Victivallales bacterium]|nr:hypothetical protein [Victivallales bacterium]